MNGPTFATARTPVPVTRPLPASPRPTKVVPKPDADAANGLRVLTYLRLHWLMILFCGSLLGAGLAFAAWELMPSKYESYALIQVSSVPTQIANHNNPNQARTDFTTYLKTTATLLKSEFVLNAALRDMRDVSTVREQKEPIKYLEEEVTVNWQDGSEVIRITFKGDRPNDTKKVVDAVQAAFMSEVVMTDVKEKQIFLQKVQEAKIELLTMLEGRAKAANHKSNVLPVGGQAPAGNAVVPANANTPAVPGQPGLLPIPGADGMPALGAMPAVVAPVPPTISADEMLRKLDPRIIVQDMATLRREVDRLPMQIDHAKRTLASVVGRLNLLEKSAAEPMSLQNVEKDPDVINMSMRAKASHRKYEIMLGTGDKANPAPGVIRLREDWEADEKALDAMKKEKLAAIEGTRKGEEKKKLLAEGDVADREVRRLLDQQKIAQDQLAKAEKLIRDIKFPEVSAISGQVEKDDSYNPGVTVRNTEDGVLSSLVKQYLMTQMELQSPPRVRVLQKASQPTQKDIKKQIIATVAAGLMGFALVALGVIAFEMMSRKVSSLADLKSAGPAPVVGVIPCVPNQATGKDPAKRAAANEAIDKLRSYVAQTWFSRGATTVAITSAVGDEGKAFTAFGLASSLSQAGYKTLLVDFDLRVPSLHAYAGLPNQAGVCEALRGEADAVKSIQTLPNGLSLLTAGRWSDEARKAAVGGKLDSLLMRLKDPFDCVVLHGHALLTAAEAVEVARRCEVVLVCALYRETKAPLLRKATDRVAAMEIPHSGVVYIGASENEALC